MTFIPLTGASSGGSKPSNWTVRERLRNITKALTAGSSLDLRFAEKFFYQNDALYPAMELMATHSRTSRAWYPNWDFKNGSEVGRLVEYGADERRYGDYGALDEGASTNQNPNPRFEGGAAGALNGAGALHTNGAHVNADAMNVAYGTEDGWPYLELSYNGTPPGTMWVTILGAGIASASNGQDWTLSLGMRLVSGSLSNVTEVQPRVRAHSGAGSTIQELSENITPDSLHRRHVISGTFTDANTASAGCLLRIATSGAVNFTLRIYAPQLEQASSPSSPILPTAGTPAAAVRAADIVTGVTTDRASRGWYDTQWDYTNGGECGDLLEFLPGVPRVGPQGLLVEEGTTNEIRNPRAEGATAGVIGSGGVVPTSWAGFGALSIEVISVSTENGWPEATFRLTGSGSGATYIGLQSGGIAGVVAGSPYTVSVNARVSGGTPANITGIDYYIDEQNSGGGYNGTFVGGDILSSLDAVARRFFVTPTATAGAAFSAPNIRIIHDGVVDITLSISAPQLEKKAYPTSVVLPEAGSPAAATRDADYAALSLGAWFNESTGTMFFDYQPNTAGAAGKVLGGFGSTFDNTLYVGETNAGTRWSGAVRSGGALSGLLTPGGQSDYSVGSTHRAAIAYAQDDFAMPLNGATQAIDVAGNVPVSPSRAVLGGAPWSATAGNSFNGFIRAVRYFPTRLSNSELEALVA